MLLIACVRASLDLFDRAGGMTILREKSTKLTSYLELLLTSRLGLGQYIHIFTPPRSEERGCQLSITFRNCDIGQMYDLLKRRGVICDIRKPDVMRIAPTPLYNSYCDVYDFVCILEDIVMSLHNEKKGSEL